MEDLTEDCIEGGGDDDIECIDFVYPVTVFEFDIDDQVADVFVLEDDEELYELIKEIEEDDLISFGFPFTVLIADGREIEINDNAELESVIEDYADSCDEEDEIEDDDDDPMDDEQELIDSLTEILTSDRWIISQLVDQEDITEEFVDFEFDFDDDGTVSAIDPNDDFEGAWGLEIIEEVLFKELGFGDQSPLDSAQRCLGGCRIHRREN